MCLQCPWRPEEGVGSSGIGVRVSCELSRGHWESKSRPLGKQMAPSTTEPPPLFKIHAKGGRGGTGKLLSDRWVVFVFIIFYFL